MTAVLSATKDQSAGTTRAAGSALKIARNGVIAGLLGAVTLAAYGAAAKGLSVPLKAQGPGSHSVTAITPAAFASGVVFSTFWGTVLAIAINRYARRPVRTFRRTTAVLVLASMINPLAATHIATSTRLTLMVGHLIAAAIVIPLLTRSLNHR